jgi:hypothetical protein
MMTTSDQRRTSPGTPDAGQFAAKLGSRPASALHGAPHPSAGGDLRDADDGCSHCGASLDDGEGYDGYCGSCADLPQQHEDGEHSDSSNPDCPDC